MSIAYFPVEYARGFNGNIKSEESIELLGNCRFGNNQQLSLTVVRKVQRLSRNRVEYNYSKR